VKITLVRVAIELTLVGTLKIWLIPIGVTVILFATIGIELIVSIRINVSVPVPRTVTLRFVRTLIPVNPTIGAVPPANAI
jgi:hypothetical protein